MENRNDAWRLCPVGVERVFQLAGWCSALSRYARIQRSTCWLWLGIPWTNALGSLKFWEAKSPRQDLPDAPNSQRDTELQPAAHSKRTFEPIYSRPIWYWKDDYNRASRLLPRSSFPRGSETGKTAELLLSSGPDLKVARSQAKITNIDSKRRR